MICLKIKSTKEFMNKFLMTEAFADFLLAEAVITTSVHYTIDGHIRKDFYTKEEQAGQEFPEFVEWEALRPQVFSMVKGKHTPLLMKLVLAYKPQKTELLLSMSGQGEEKRDAGNPVKDLFCTVKYENGNITLVGGVSYQGFTMDKNPEKRWDMELCRLLDCMELAYEIV